MSAKKYSCGILIHIRYRLCLLSELFTCHTCIKMLVHMCNVLQDLFVWPCGNIWCVIILVLLSSYPYSNLTFIDNLKGLKPYFQQCIASRNLVLFAIFHAKFM